MSEQHEKRKKRMGWFKMLSLFMHPSASQELRILDLAGVRL